MIYGTFYDGKTSAKKSCALRVDELGSVQLDGVDFEPCLFSEITISPRVGNTARYLVFPNGARFETDNNQAVDQLIHVHIPPTSFFNAHQWESKITYIALSALLVVAVLIGLAKFGIPYASKEIAYRLPAYYSAMLAGESLEQLDGVYFSKTELDADRQDSLRAQFRSYQPANSEFQFTLLFRKSKLIGANAFALPDGHVIMTDELVALASVDEEIIAILLHEMGHVVHRHAMRRAIESAGLYGIYSWMSGDLQVASAMILALPAILLNAQYSQGHETEADSYSLEQMQQHRIDPIHFANIMTKLEEAHKIQQQQKAEKQRKKAEMEKTSTSSEMEEADVAVSEEPSQEETEKKQMGEEQAEDIMDFMSSHPPTRTRIQRFIDASEKMQSTR